MLRPEEGPSTAEARDAVVAVEVADAAQIVVGVDTLNTPATGIAHTLAEGEAGNTNNTGQVAEVGVGLGALLAMDHCHAQVVRMGGGEVEVEDNLGKGIGEDQYLDEGEVVRCLERRMEEDRLGEVVVVGLDTYAQEGAEDSLRSILAFHMQDKFLEEVVQC